MNKTFVFKQLSLCGISRCVSAFLPIWDVLPSQALFFGSFFPRVVVYALCESFFLTGLKDEHVSAVAPDEKLLFLHIYLMYFSYSVAAVGCFSRQSHLIVS